MPYTAAELRSLAPKLWQVYESLIRQGFSQRDALSLISCMILSGNLR